MLNGLITIDPFVIFQDIVSHKIMQQEEARLHIEKIADDFFDKWKVALPELDYYRMRQFMDDSYNYMRGCIKDEHGFRVKFKMNSQRLECKLSSDNDVTIKISVRTPVVKLYKQYASPM